MLSVTGLHKSYAGHEVVSGVGFEVGRGEIVGLLGPNGAGNTTTVAMICSLVAAGAGQVLIALQMARVSGPGPSLSQRKSPA
jgi:lipopolysaccharide export system ATP-binding protein